MRLLVLSGGVVAVLAWTVDSGAQSLGDIARREADRRGATAPVTKTYTNDNLTPDFTTPLPPADTVAGKDEGGATGAVKGDGSSRAANEGAEPGTELTAEEAAQQQLDDPEKWGVTPRDQQVPAPKDDHNEEFWRSRSALLKSRLANQNAQIEQLRQRLEALRGSSDEERQVVERTMAKAQSDLEYIHRDWIRFERQARDRKVPEHWWR